MSQLTVQSCTFKKSGNGARGPWTLYTVVLNDGREATGFDQVNPGETVEVTETQNGQYTNLNYKKVGGTQAAPAAQQQQQQAQPQGQPAATPGVAGTGDPRVLKMAILIAEQIGVSKEAIMEVLQG